MSVYVCVRVSVTCKCEGQARGITEEQAKQQLGREWLCMWHQGHPGLCCPLGPTCHTMLDFAKVAG